MQAPIRTELGIDPVLPPRRPAATQYNPLPTFPLPTSATHSPRGAARTMSAPQSEGQISTQSAMASIGLTGRLQRQGSQKRRKSSIRKKIKHSALLLDDALAFGARPAQEKEEPAQSSPLPGIARADDPSVLADKIVADDTTDNNADDGSQGDEHTPAKAADGGQQVASLDASIGRSVRIVDEDPPAADTGAPQPRRRAGSLAVAGTSHRAPIKRSSSVPRDIISATMSTGAQWRADFLALRRTEPPKPTVPRERRPIDRNAPVPRVSSRRLSSASEAGAAASDAAPPPTEQPRRVSVKPPDAAPRPPAVGGAAGSTDASFKSGAPTTLAPLGSERPALPPWRPGGRRLSDPVGAQLPAPARRASLQPLQHRRRSGSVPKDRAPAAREGARPKGQLRPLEQGDAAGARAEGDSASAQPAFASVAPRAGA